MSGASKEHVAISGRYLVVAQDRVIVEHHARRDDGSWLLNDYRSAGDMITLKRIQCQLLLAEVHDKVDSHDRPKNQASPQNHLREVQV